MTTIFLPALRVWTLGRRAPHGSSSVRQGSHRCDGGGDVAGVGVGGAIAPLTAVDAAVSLSAGLNVESNHIRYHVKIDGEDVKSSTFFVLLLWP